MRNYWLTLGLIFGAILLFSCNSSKNVSYYKIKLTQYEDYNLKFDKIIHYLKNFDDDAQTICNSVLTDLIVFEGDIQMEIDQNNALTHTQIDTLDLMRRQVRAIRKFLDCIAWCSEYPTLSSDELDMACELLSFNTLEIDHSRCAKVIEARRERFLFYFIINLTQFNRAINYGYDKFNGGNDLGVKYLAPEEAAAIFGVFNEFTSDWIVMRSVLCD